MHSNIEYKIHRFSYKLIGILAFLLGTEMYYTQSIHNDELVNDLLSDEVQWQKLCVFLWTVLILTELFLIQINK